MAISSLEDQEVDYFTIVKGRTCQYFGSWAMNRKTKDTFISQTLKVEEKKVFLVLLFVIQEPRNGRSIF